MESKEQQLTKLLIYEVKRRIIIESVPRIKKCLAKLSSEEIWYRPNNETVSVGNLVLHLCGNVRQWVLSGIGKLPDDRKRDSEFSEMGPIPRTTLINALDTLTDEVMEVLNKVTVDDILTMHNVQGYKETGMSILVHVTEHFSYHTGQITYFVKSNKNVDMNYYKGHDLNKK